LKGNLTNERNTLYIDSERQDPFFETEISRTFIVGVSVKFYRFCPLAVVRFAAAFFITKASNKNKC
jgi:hypothetical protein